MDFDQLIKRMDWLDEERRKDKSAIAVLEERLAGLEGDLKTANKKIKDLTAALAKVSSAAATTEQVDASLARLRKDLTKLTNALEQKQQTAAEDTDKRYQLQFKTLTKSSAEVGKLKSSLAEVSRTITAWQEEHAHRLKQMSEWEARMQAVINSAEEVQRAQKVLEESRKADVKRVADLQGDLSSIRKRLNETSSRNDILTGDLRRVETRLNELLASEADRRQEQVNFVESQNLLHAERERLWKEWESAFESLKENSSTIERRLQEWEIAQHAVRRAQETYEDLAQKFERRINEISEMQRLTEDRFRQEWVTFKADEQKRWTSFTLTQDEIRNDLRAELTKLQSALTALGDQAQTQQDMLEQTQDANQQLFQGMLSQIHELLAAYERIMSTR